MRLSDDVRAEFYKKQRLRNVTAQYNLKRDQLSTTGNSPDAFISKGVYISNVYDSINGFYEPLKSIHIQNVSYYVDSNNAGVTVDLKVVDLDTSAVIFTKSVTLTNGWNSWDIEFNCASSYYSNPNRVFVYLHTAGLYWNDKVTPQRANAVCNAGGKLLKIIEMEHRFGRITKNTTRQFTMVSTPSSRS